jgi:hypothetical protein
MAGRGYCGTMLEQEEQTEVVVALREEVDQEMLED